MRLLVAALAIAGAVLGMCVCTNGQAEAAVPYTYDDGTQGSIRCEYTSSTLLPGLPRVDIGLGPASVEVNGSEFFYVRHGWGGWPPQCCEAWGWNEVGLPELTAFLLLHVRFELRINGAAIPPSYIRVDPADGKIAWYFEFPAHTFSTGVYVFEGHWSRQPLDVSGCLDSFEPAELVDGNVFPGYDRIQSCLVTVLDQ